MKKLIQILCSFLLVFATVIFIQKETLAIVYTIDAPLSGFQVVPTNPSTALGSISGTFDDVSNVLTFQLTFTGLLSPTTAASFNSPGPRGVNAPVTKSLAGFPVGVFSGAYSNTYTLTDAQKVEVVGGLWYIVVMTNASPAGEIRGQLAEGTLPVELSSFVSNIYKNNVVLNWSTTKEINNAGFDVERKLFSSTQWAKVANVAGNGNSNEIKNYTFTEKLSAGTYNYRLRQIDFNGNFKYFNLSNEVKIEIPLSYNMSQNYPNPFNPSTKIDYEIPYEGRVNIILYDMSGKEISSLVNEVKSAGYYTVQLNASNLSSGAYFYKIFVQSGIENFTLTKLMTVIK